MDKIVKARSILYVEDDPSIREPMQEALVHFCNDLYVAVDGQDGYDKYVQYKPDIIITDLRLPVFDGLVMSKMIKEIDSEVIIIIASAHNDLEYYREALDLKIDEYLIKPIKFNVLQHKIAKYVEKIELKETLAKQEILIKEQDKKLAMNKMYSIILNQWKHPITTINQISLNTKKGLINNTIPKKQISKNLDDIIEQTLLISNTMDDLKNFFDSNSSKSNVSLDYSIKTTLKYIQAGLEQNNITLNIEQDINVHDYISSKPNDICIILLNILNFAKEMLLEIDDKPREINLKIYTHEKEVLFDISFNGKILEKEFIESLYNECTINEQTEPLVFGLCITRIMIQEHLNGEIIIQNQAKTFIPQFLIKLPLV